MATLSGGKKFEKAMQALARKVAKPATLRVGFLEGATYPDKNNTPVALVAAIQNYGAPKARIPPRPFFSNMISQKKGEWPAAFAELLKDNDYDVVAALEIGGKAIEGQLRESIRNTNAPPLSMVTLMLRKMQYADSTLVVTGKTVGEARRRVAAGESVAGVPTKPLIWTNLMIDSVNSEVKT